MFLKYNFNPRESPRFDVWASFLRRFVESYEIKSFLWSTNVQSHLGFCALTLLTRYFLLDVFIDSSRNCNGGFVKNNVRTWINTAIQPSNACTNTVYPKKCAHGFVMLCFVVVMQSFIMNSHEVFIHIHQGCFAGTGAIVRLPQCQWSKPDGYGKISQCITTTKKKQSKTVCIFLGIYCSYRSPTRSAGKVWIF